MSRVLSLLLLSVVLAAPGSAQGERRDSREESKGGALSQVVGGMKDRSGQGGDRGRGSSSEARGESTRSSDHEVYDDPGWGTSYPAGVGVSAYEPYPAQHGPSADFKLYLGLQRIDDSDGALAASLRASHGDFGFSLANTAYYESFAGDRGTEVLELHVWSVAASMRAPGTRPGGLSSLWLSGGLAGATSDGLTLFGGVLGAEAEHILSGSLGVEASARLLLYQDDIRGLELRSAVTASILRVGYRIMKFNVGPPLRGPEVGVALQF